MKSSISLVSSLTFCLVGSSLQLSPASAQVTADGTTNTTVNSDGDNFIIEQGDRVGDNLFHSFDEFSVPTMGSAAFNNANDIANIFSRVTGGNISNIDGLLSANGTANLYLINPNGIIFGENARLNLGGSFFASSADSLLFDGGLEFSASNPTAPPLLEVNIPIGLGFRDNPGEIVNRSFVQNDVGEFVGLEVAPGQNLTLVGGNINFEAGEATAKGGNIQLGGLSAAGTVSISDDGSLSFPEDVERADINLSNAADVDVRGTGGGSITINARNLKLEAGEFGFSQLRAGITADSTSADVQAGDIRINATENVTVDDSSIANQVDPEAVGNAGGVIISTGYLFLTNGGQVSAGTLGRGNGGSVEITARDTIAIDGEDSDGFSSSANSEVASGVEGDGGGVIIDTGSLSLTNGGQVTASTFGIGSAGSVEITVADSITIDGENSEGFVSGATSGVGTEAEGDGTGVIITTRTLSLTNGGQVTAGTLGRGNAGSVKITASDSITIDGENSEGFSSGATSLVVSGAEGDAGGVTIDTGSLSLTNGGRVSAGTGGDGNAGLVKITATDTITIDGEDSESFVSSANSIVGTQAEGDAGGVTIDTGSLSLTNGGRVSADTFGQGNAGSVKITASDITIDGEASDAVPSNVSSSVTEEAEGDAGGVTIDTGSLSLTNGGRVIADTFGRGNAGTVKITASDQIAIDGETSEGFVSEVSSAVALEEAEGNAGGISIDTGSLSLTNGGRVIADTFGRGNAGSVRITAKDTISIDGENSEGFVSNVSSSVNSAAEGDAGGVTIDTGSLSLTNGGRVIAGTFGQGNAGSVQINASDTITIDGENSEGFVSGATSAVASEEAEGNAGGVIINTDSLSLTNGGQVDASTFGTGNGGSVNIIATDAITIDGENSEGFVSGATSAVASEEAEGNAGGVIINTDSLSLTNGGQVNASTFGQGDAGSVEIIAADTITIDGVNSGGTSSGFGSEVDSEAVGNAGGVTIKTGSLSLTNGGQVSASTFGQGDAGDVTVNARELIFISDATERTGSGISADAFISNGNGGDVNVFTNQLTINDGGSIQAGNFDSLDVFDPGTGQPGNINIEANSLSLNQARIEATTQSEVGEAANINLNIAEDIFFKKNSSISARAFGNANGGNVTINADDGSIVAFPNQDNDIIANAQQGNGGNINITTQAIFGLEERPSTPPNQTNDIDASSEFGLQGDFSLNTPENEPSRGLIDLPENVVNPEDLISQNACKQGGQSKFTLTGRGGLPATPERIHSSDEVEVGLVKPAIGVAAVSKDVPVAEDSTKIVPARGWIRNEQGEVFLVGYDPTVSNITPQSENLDLCQPQGND